MQCYFTGSHTEILNGVGNISDNEIPGWYFSRAGQRIFFLAPEEWIKKFSLMGNLVARIYYEHNSGGEKCTKCSLTRVVCIRGLSRVLERFLTLFDTAVKNWAFVAS